MFYCILSIFDLYDGNLTIKYFSSNLVDAPRHVSHLTYFSYISTSLCDYHLDIFRDGMFGKVD